ncbi:NACHT, LRR and PYD domains-containing protein 14-like isoform X6 [Pristis pectinata]|uniref:NACHT, LRR and PYD domains-containing protein 14-like isoform X6 n=1 Tax=Pristis pectinata TaxID=685728 RepID=UPI00223E8E18|nr:NACHT, LRR and PYD domains-containing protein 14-like isoform X6 [Pristis pectinata]XP_051865756.1 NACHT, LRR and PYD domains-containing protein 14-like isoform X6 [Pristis pectinata]
MFLPWLLPCVQWTLPVLQQFSSSLKVKVISTRKYISANMAFRQQVERLTEEAICPICLDFFTDPVTLDCGHNFCRSCITQCWEKEVRNCCPQCREQFADRTLRVNRALASLAENVQKLKLNVKETEIRPQCEKHQEELKLFCDTDKQLICLICRDAREHKSHNFMPIVEAVEIYKNQVKSSLECLTEKKSAIQQMEQQQKQKISGLREQSHTLQANITSQFAKMHQVLSEREQRLLGDLREEEGRILNTMENNLREIQENLTSVEERLSTLQEQMDQKDSVVFLKEEVCQERRVSEDAQALSVAEGALPVGKLRDMVLRETFDAMKQVSETLDVESVNPCLEVSEDLSRGRGTGTQMNLPDTGKSQGLSDLGDWGMKLLSEVLRDPECKVQRLGLKAGSLATADVEDLTLALSTNRSLTELELDLAWNDLGDSGVKLVSEALRNPECKIHKLGLWCVGLTAAGVVDLASALSTNRSLTELDLGGNKLGDSGVKLVSEALRNPECKIQKLGLQRVGLTAAGVVDLASALRTNRSLTELDLIDNDLGDSGVKLVSEALRNPECKIHKLDLGWTGLTDSGTNNLVSVLSTNRSLRELDLRSNSLTDRSVPALRRLTQTLPCLEWLRLDENEFSLNGRDQLKSLAGTRARLRVVL